MRFRDHTYTWSKPFGSARHHWSLRGPRGGISFSASGRDGDETCGLEFHHAIGFQHDPHVAASHINCPITGGACWHDGTSLYATENLWPMFKTYVARGEHDKIFRFLEREYDDRFGAAPKADDEDAA